MRGEGAINRAHTPEGKGKKLTATAFSARRPASPPQMGKAPFPPPQRHDLLKLVLDPRSNVKTYEVFVVRTYATYPCICLPPPTTLASGEAKRHDNISAKNIKVFCVHCIGKNMCVHHSAVSTGTIYAAPPPCR